MPVGYSVNNEYKGKSWINFRRVTKTSIKIDFTRPTHGKGEIWLYSEGKYIKTLKIDLNE